jgi:hypothetical protein
MEEYKEEKVVADHVFPVPCVGICLSRMSRYDTTLCVCDIGNEGETGSAWNKNGEQNHCLNVFVMLTVAPCCKFTK